MEKFAFIIHPINARRDVARKGGIYRVAQYLPEQTVEWLIKHKEPIVASHITGIVSATGAEAEGWFIACPLTPRQLLELPQEFVYQRLIQCGQLAESLGAKIIGLGAFTSVVGDGGQTVAKSLNIAVTTGNSYTVATAVEGALDAARRMEIDIARSKVAVVGASGSIGRTCAHLLAPRAAEVALIGRDLTRLQGRQRTNCRVPTWRCMTKSTRACATPRSSSPSPARRMPSFSPKTSPPAASSATWPAPATCPSGSPKSVTTCW